MPGTLTLTPEADINPVGTSHTVTATARDALGNPWVGAQICFFVDGSVDFVADGSCTTNTSGQCNFTYGGPLSPGADLIEAFVNQNSNRDCLHTPDPFLEFPQAEATKAWIFTTPPEGSVTGGGQTGGRPVTFGFNARTDPKINGTCTVIDQSTDPHIMIKCTTVISVTVVQAPTEGGTAHIEATGTINGVQTSIQIDVTDVSEPNRGADQFLISTPSYSGGGPVTQGNIQVHR